MIKMDKEFLDLLVQPVTKQKLKYNSKEKKLIDNAGNSYCFIENVPVLLEVTNEGAGFDYQEHYTKDAETYDYFEEWDPISKIENDRLHEHVLSGIPDHTDWILDVGSGNAWLANALCAKKRKVISMDISTTNPVKALKMYPYPYHYGLVADVYALPFASESIDCIVAAEVIEHVPDPKSFIKQLLSILKPGGTLIITTPYNEKIQHSLCIHCNNLTPHNAHLHSFTAGKLKSLVPDIYSNIRTKVFNNKMLVRLRIQKILRFLPFKLWNLIDKTATKFHKSAFRLMMVVKK